MKTTDWYGLYSSGWGSDLVPEAYSHPAKVRPDLARKIYEHAIEEGWLEAGSIVLDPFGGIAGFALSAMKYGMHFIGVELEARFVELGRQNIELWNKKYSTLPGWGSAVLLRGDSRNLAQVVAEAGAVVSSPPFMKQQEGGKKLLSQRDQMTIGRRNCGYRNQGETPGNLAALSKGDLAAALESTREDVSDNACAIYLAFFNPNDGKALFLEIFVLPGILSLLRRCGMPVFAVNLDDEIARGQIEITMVPSDLELPDISNADFIEEFGESLFKLAGPGFSIASNRTIDPAPILEAMRLHGKQTPAGRAFALDSVSARFVEAFSGAELAASSVKDRLENVELFATLLTAYSDMSTSTPSTTEGAIASPLFGLAWRNKEVLAASLASQRYSGVSKSARTFIGAALIESLCDLARLGMEWLSTDNASAIGYCSLEDSITLMGAESIFGPRLHLSFLPGKLDAALRTGQSNYAHCSPPVIKSPPIIIAKERNVNATAGGLAAAISSPPYAGGCQHTGGDDPKPEYVKGGEYRGVGIAGAIASPPYAGGRVHGGGIDPSKFAEPGRAGQTNQAEAMSNYGSHPAQLGQMRDGGFAEACVSSPPYEGSHVGADDNPYINVPGGRLGLSKTAHLVGNANYGNSPKQLGQESSDTFWAASRLIVKQVYQVLKPGGVAIWVTKAFVRKGKRVDFPGQWRELCEACGFVTLHQHRAWLVEDKGDRRALFDFETVVYDDTGLVRERKIIERGKTVRQGNDGKIRERELKRVSFFRRLAEKKGSPPIDYEVVICLQKPPSAGA